MSFGPPVPGFINRVNFITNYLWQGCDVPFQLFVELAGPPAGRAVALLIDTDWQDIVKTFWRPAGLRSHRHGRKGPRGRRRVPELPDVNDEIGKRIPYQKEFAGRPYGLPTRLFFEITDVSDRLAINLAIVDIVTDTTYQALLGIIEADASKCYWMKRGRAYARNITHLTTGGGFVATPCPNPEYEIGVQMLHAGAQTFGGGTYMVTFQQTFMQFGAIESTTAIGLYNSTTGEMIAESEELSLSETQGGTLAVSATVKGGHTILYMIKNSGNHVTGLNASATVIQMSQ